MKQVYHTKLILKENPDVLVILLLSMITFTVWVYLSWGDVNFYFDLLLLFSMNILANFDAKTGRIPICFLLIGLTLGLIIGIQKDQLIQHVICGLTNLVISTLIYLTGQIYSKKILNHNHLRTVFGMGDVYASGGMGFLLGFPSGNVAILLTLILAVFGAGIKSILTGEKFLKRSVNLGSSFYLATAIILIIK